MTEVSKVSEAADICERLKLNSILLEMAMSVSKSEEANQLASKRIDLCEEAAALIDELRGERDSARQEAADLRKALLDEQLLSIALREALKGLEPHFDAIACYASSMDEHEPNRLVFNARAAIAKATQ